MGNTIKYISIGLLCLLAILFAVSWYFSSLIIRFQTHSLQQDKINLKIDSPADFGLGQPQTIKIKINATSRVAGWLFENPKFNSQNPCAVILLHGHTGTRYGALKYAPIFWRRGCHLFAWDAPYHGESSGEYGTYGYYERYALLSTRDWLVHRFNMPATRIGLMGESMGAAISIMAAAVPGPDFYFVVAESPYSDLKQILTERGVNLHGGIVYAFVPLASSMAYIRSGMVIEDAAPREHIPAIAEPLLILHSKQDSFTGIHHAYLNKQAMQNANQELKVSDWGAKHARSIDSNRKEFETMVDSFLDKIMN